MNEKPFATFQNVIFFILLGIITIFFGYLLQVFFFALFWAVLITGFFSPLNKIMLGKLRSPNLSASITLVVIIICLILPVGLLISLLINEFIEIYKAVDSDRSRWLDNITSIINYLNNHPLFARLDINHDFFTAKSAEILKAVSEFIFKNLSDFTQNTVVLVIQFVVMFYSLFFFLRDGDRFISTILHYIPVGKYHMDTFISHFLNTAKATLKITFVIGGLQGLLGGLLFYITGIDNALIWGVLMFGLAVVPLVGCSLIWAPAGIIMLFLGHIWQGVTILAFGALVISSVDNLLRPVLVGHNLQMHPLLIFLSTLGGLAVFGVSGFVLGPVIASLFLASWRLFLELHKKEEIES
ncbi:MAG TPA: AI-2E family transporter [Smithellaceae bacterium]|mgnify:CR=1 FL=1|nr:AI-2E family transporter [Smithellaceae bacterium]HRS88802.1 AI-2E family transporter [Smithellaceae bacterium]HRV25762.1 AI-2E family transporter [Smithellaceae bacterium]